MMKIDYKQLKVSFTPTKKDLKEIESWLIIEFNTSKEGFYCNWNEIIHDFENGNLAIISYCNDVIGFATWYHAGFKATLEIVEISKSYREKGVGKFLIDMLFIHFLKLKIYVVDLQCNWPSIIPIWKKLGFINYPEEIQRYIANNKLYKILIPICKPITKSDNKNIIELWCDEPGANIDPSGVWGIEHTKNSKKLIEPIIHPCSNEWQIRLSNNGIKIFDDKIKRLRNGMYYKNGFIFIHELPSN